MNTVTVLGNLQTLDSTLFGCIPQHRPSVYVDQVILFVAAVYFKEGVQTPLFRLIHVPVCTSTGIGSLTSNSVRYLVPVMILVLWILPHLILPCSHRP